MDGIDTAIQKAEFLLTSVNSSVAVLEDASKTDWLLTHISSKSGGLPADLNSVRYDVIIGYIIMMTSSFFIQISHFMR